MKTEKQIAQELHDELVRQLIEKYNEYDLACLHEPLKKQDKLCAEQEHIREKISLLEKRYSL